MAKIYLHTIIPEEVKIPGIGLNGFVSILSIGIIGYSIADLIFFPIYYKNGKSIVLSTLFMIFGFIAYLATFTLIFPNIPGMEWYVNLLTGNIGIQFIIFGVALIICAATHYLVYRISSKRLEKVDF